MRQRWLLVPKSLRRAAREALAWCVILADDDGSLARADLADVLDSRDPANLRRILVELEQHGLVRRVMVSRHQRRRAKKVGDDVDDGQRLRVAYAGVYGGMWKRCLNCPRPAKNVRGARYCSVCQAAVARHDRAWKRDAFEIWADGMKLKQSEAHIVYRVCGATGHPMFTPRDAGADQKREGVVQFMLGEGMLRDAFWRERIRSHQANEGDDLA